MDTYQLIEKLAQLTGQRIILEATVIEPFQVREGDIISTQKYGKLGVVSYPSRGRTLTKFHTVRMNDLENILKTGRGIGEMTARPNSTFEKVGTLDPKQLKQLKDILNGQWEKQNAQATKNMAAVDYSHDLGKWDAAKGWHVNLANGKKAYVGDTVLIKFDNGNFKGVLKAAAGTRDGKVTVQMPGRSKGRTLNPDRIIDVVG